MGRVPIGEASTRMLLYAWLLVAIPAAAAIVAGLLLALRPRRARRLRSAAAAAGCGCGTAERQCGQHTRLRPGLARRQQADPDPAEAVRAGRQFKPRRRAALRQAAISSIAILGAVDVLRRGRHRLPTRWRGHWPARWRTWRPCTNRAAIRRDRPGVAVGHAAPAARAALDEMHDAIMRYAESPDAPAGATGVSDASAAGRLPPARPHGCVHRADRAQARRLFLPDAGTNPEHIAYALKTTGAAMFCYLLYTLLDWPGIHTCVITCYIVRWAAPARPCRSCACAWPAA